MMEYPSGKNIVTILDGKPVATAIKRDIISKMEVIKSVYGSSFIKPCLAIISVGENKASESYIKGKIKDCDECGFDVMPIKIHEDCSLKVIIDNIKTLSLDHHVNGIILQLPLPEKFSKKEVQELFKYIDYDKDVDCLTNMNIGRLSHGEALIKPCTPASIMEILSYYDIDVSGKDVTIINRSDIVGKPLATMLTQADATVTLCHTKTSNLERKAANADILIVGVGKENFINAENVTHMVRHGAVVIDVGINRTSEGKLVGDTNFDIVSKQASAITPVPGGVGLVTRACLMRNLYLAYEKQLRMTNESIIKTNTVDDHALNANSIYN